MLRQEPAHADGQPNKPSQGTLLISVRWARINPNIVVTLLRGVSASGDSRLRSRNLQNGASINWAYFLRCYIAIVAPDVHLAPNMPTCDQSTDAGVARRRSAGQVGVEQVVRLKSVSGAPHDV